jgi:isoleucyl-tRNA synthetase
MEDVKESKDYHFPTEETAILKLWEELDAFHEQLRRSEGRPEFIFYDGPPFATGMPHYGHLLAGTIKVRPSTGLQLAAARPPAAAAAAVRPPGRLQQPAGRLRTQSPWLRHVHLNSLFFSFAAALQDIVTRYATATGHHVSRRFGWDCHGLPVEHEIDKKLSECTFNVSRPGACRALAPSGAQARSPARSRLCCCADIKSRDDVMAMGIDKYNEECRAIVMRYSKEWETIVTRIGRWIDFEVRAPPPPPPPPPLF